MKNFELYGWSKQLFCCYCIDVVGHETRLGNTMLYDTFESFEVKVFVVYKDRKTFVNYS